jgi:hypothetical protein
VLAAAVCLPVRGSDSTAMPDDPLLRPDSIIAFADYLSESGDCMRACLEYGRALACVLPESEKEKLLEKKARCYVVLGRYDTAAVLLGTLENGAHDDSQVLQYGEELYRAFVAQGKLDSARAAARMLKVKTGSVRALGMEVAACLNLDDTAGAASAFSAGPARMKSDSMIYPLFDSWLARYKSLPRKSSVAAGLLSAVVPGSGKIYAGRMRDGLFAAGLTAFFSLQCYDGFRRYGYRSLKGWLFSIIALDFYAGNIYGSVIETRSFNHRKRKELLNDIEFSLKVQILGR